MNRTLKTLLPVAVIATLAVAAWYAMDTGNLHVNIDGDQIDGPLGAALGVLFGGAGLLIGAVAVACAAVLVGLLFASLGVLMVAGLALLALALAAAISPLLLPLLIPAAIYWLWSSRSRQRRERAMLEHAL